MIVRPTSYGTWASGTSGYVAEPIQADKNQGFLPTGIARASYANWLWNAAGQWHQYLDEEQRARVFRESWTTFGAGLTAYAGRIPENARWSAGTTGADSPRLGLIGPTDMWPEPSMDFDPGRALGSKITLASTLAMVASGVSGTVQALTSDVSIRTTSGSATVVHGVAAMVSTIPTTGPDVFTGISGLNATGYAWFRRAAGITAWLAEVAPTGASAVSSVNTGVAPKAFTEGPQQLRIELCAPNSFFGAVTRFMIDGVLVATGPAYQKAGSLVSAIRIDASGINNMLVGVLDWSIYK